jgi:hypothetical protein
MTVASVARDVQAAPAVISVINPSGNSPALTITPETAAR